MKVKATFAAVGLVSIGLACFGPTEIRLSVTADFPCPTKMKVYVGSEVPSSTTNAVNDATSCVTLSPTDADLGSLVISPSGDRRAALRVTVVARDGGEAGACLDPSAKATGCFVARRIVSFRPHESVQLPVRLYASCRDVLCSADRTCVAGRCVAADPASVDAACADGQCDGGLASDAGPNDSFCRGGLLTASASEPFGRLVYLADRLFWVDRDGALNRYELTTRKLVRYLPPSGPISALAPSVNLPEVWYSTNGPGSRITEPWDIPSEQTNASRRIDLGGFQSMVVVGDTLYGATTGSVYAMNVGRNAGAGDAGVVYDSGDPSRLLGQLASGAGGVWVAANTLSQAGPFELVRVEPNGPSALSASLIVEATASRNRLAWTETAQEVSFVVPPSLAARSLVRDPTFRVLTAVSTTLGNGPKAGTEVTLAAFSDPVEVGRAPRFVRSEGADIAPFVDVPAYVAASAGLQTIRGLVSDGRCAYFWGLPRAAADAGSPTGGLYAVPLDP